MNNRRKFIISSLSGLAIAVLPKLTYASSNPDVVVIGAGAAGLAATSELIKNGKKVICLEASNRIGGRAYTDNEIFGEPYDLGALWLENGDTNPFKIYGEKNSKFNLYKERIEEMYAVYNGDKRTSQEDELWNLYDNTEAAIAKTRKDIAPIKVVPNQDQRWFDTVHTIIGPWQMGKDFSDFSCKDFNFDYEMPVSAPWHCKEGYGTLVLDMYKSVPVKLNTKVTEIDWGGAGVKVTTNNGVINAKKCIVTVSTGVLSSGQIIFKPKLNPEKEESFNKISMGHYNRITFKFKKLFKKKPKDYYLYYKIDSQNASSPEGFCTTIHPSDTKLCMCDPGGKFAFELAKSGEQESLNFALNELKKIFGNKIEKDLIKSHSVDWSNNPLFLGSWAAAEPGAFKYREILRNSVGDRIYFAGEATAKDWGTVAGAQNSGVLVANKIINI
jgi:monoamine oxidase